MVKRQKKHSAKRGMNQGQNEGREEPAKISPNTRYEYCSERLSPFGGLLALEKFMDAVKFREVFEGFYLPPGRTPDQGHYRAVYGILVLLALHRIHAVVAFSVPTDGSPGVRPVRRVQIAARDDLLALRGVPMHQSGEVAAPGHGGASRTGLAVVRDRIHYDPRQPGHDG